MNALLKLAILMTIFPALYGQSSQFLPTRTSISAMTDPESREAREAPPQAAAYRGWQRSLIPLVAAQTLDIASSYGRPELNPLLASSSGRFGVQAVGIKAGTTAGMVVLEYLLVRKHPAARRARFQW